mmetsp:Transcript_52/g.177  ORF Transcript_52/g.177 Transcript_52/m.177 type:complete len:366 (+) Transcript_52:52-1149(+)|eukprot:CAMPEP_0114620622 /NCGR_PEP_ID=MMETSP0168-20121206/8820_1 /TAXON_ID=95228 ORGANISM="Vannella sp., Strain DIVA3 517/6/12" /NCGR_SAMPLE_ID=MMETSP0168 /ASSEMBLY_ACC=CAM_ASM_000044 /LENGTH=365 /DNA_ID=CAMNT_0001831819 /DNA_START=96 /DNA_END=1193 /DNA_ORIENTATION=-
MAGDEAKVADAAAAEGSGFDAELDLKLLKRFMCGSLQCLPTAYSSQESNRLMLLYFIVASHDLMDELEMLDRTVGKEALVNWIYSQQVLPDSKDPQKNAVCCGFRGSPFIGNPWNPNCEEQEAMKHDMSHITNTYTALAILRILGDDYGRVNRPAILQALRSYQRKTDGSFTCMAAGSESDLRFVYCAACICYLLDDWSGMDVELAEKFIYSCQLFDGAFGQGPGQESHGGSTYCALAALSLMGKLGELRHRERVIRWLVERQYSGFQGRINKVPDTCYSWWVGASLELLGCYHMVDTTLCKSFHFTCQTKIGGFGKVPGAHPDVLHTYFSLCALRMMGCSAMQPLHFGLGLTMRAANRPTVFTK